jgi:hypothetical protein
MRANMVAVLALALAAPAMAKDLASGLTGSWAVDATEIFEASAPPFYKMATPEKKKEILADAMKSMGPMSVDITATTASIKAGTHEPEVAAFKVIKQDKTTVWADFTTQEKGKPSVDKYTFVFVDANTVKMTKEGDPAALLLKRSK